MILSKKDFLIKLALKEELSENTLAKVFAKHDGININKKQQFFDNVYPYFSRVEGIDKDQLLNEKEEQTELEDWIGKDLRIKNIKLKNIRGYPDTNKPFGIDFTGNNDEPESMVILGTNGSGKSSLYDSVEFSYCQKIGETDLREFNSSEEGIKKYHHYLEHFDRSFETAYCRIETKSNPFDIHEENIPRNIRRKINPGSHFISDYDIYKNGQLDYQKSGVNSFHTTIAESLGLSDLLEFEKNLRSFNLYNRQKESRRINSLNNRIDSEVDLIKTNQKELDEQKERLELLLNNVSPPNVDSDKEHFRSHLEEINKDLLFEYDFQNLISTIENYKNSYKIHSTEIIKKSGYRELEFLKRGLEILKHSEDCPFCNNSTLSKKAINETVKSRIESFEDSNKSSLELKTDLNLLLNELRHFTQTIEKFQSLLTREVTLIKGVVEFNSLISIDNSIINIISKISDTEFYHEIASLEENPNFLKDNEQFIFKLINDFSNYIESELCQNVEDLRNQLDKRQIIINSIENKAEEKESPEETNLREQIVLVKKSIEELQNKISESKKIIESSTVELEELYSDQENFNHLKNEVQEYLQVFHNSLNNEVEKSFNPIRNIVVNILNNYLLKENRDARIKVSKQPDQVDDETGEILSEIITAEIISTNSKFSPQPVNKYLNTFHYRLFATMVGISIAIASRIQTRINLPLVLDDIFYASDFANRATIENFLNSLFEAYNDYTPKIPLQIILFTHDALIFDSAINILKDNDLIKVNFARLYEIGQGEEYSDYIDLAFKIPDYLPEKLFQNLFIKT